MLKNHQNHFLNATNQGHIMQKRFYFNHGHTKKPVNLIW